MLDAVIRFALHQRLLVIMAAVVVLGGGIFAWNRLPIDAFPDVTNEQVMILTEAPGLTPTEMERLVTYPIETKMGGLPGVMFDKSCVNCRREMTKYRWGPTRDDLNSKEAPVKADDHCPEALKRFVAWLTGLRRMKDAQPATGGERAFKRERMPRA